MIRKLASTFVLCVVLGCPEILRAVVFTSGWDRKGRSITPPDATAEDADLTERAMSIKPRPQPKPPKVKPHPKPQPPPRPPEGRPPPAPKPTPKPPVTRPS